MPKGTKTLGKNKARAWESLGLEHKKRGCAYFDTPSYSMFLSKSFYEFNIFLTSVNLAL